MDWKKKKRDTLLDQRKNEVMDQLYVAHETSKANTGWGKKNLHSVG